MNARIKRYELNNNITKEYFLSNGFKQINENKITMFKKLYKEIDLYIEIRLLNDKLIFDDYDDVSVIDDVFCQYYASFYEGVNNDFVNKVVDRYNEEMDELASIGILVKIPEKELIKTKNN